ncbi:MAG: carboxymuconolactone decarboxylase family protein [Planctomycetota bacterium]
MFRSFSVVLASFVCVGAVIGETPTAPDSSATPTGFQVHEQAPEGTADVYEFYRSTFGFVPNLAKVMASSPSLLKSYVDTQNNLKASGNLTQAEINVVQMAIAVENKCEYCTAGHTMAGKMFFKTPMDVMQQVRMRQAMKEPKLNALRNFAILVYARRGEVGANDFQQFLDAGYTRAQALDVVACVAAKVMSNYTNSLAKTPIDAPLLPLTDGLPFAAK